MDRQKTAKIIASMFSCYGQAGDGVRIASYTNVLCDIPTDILSKVCRKLLCESKFVPSIAEILEASRSLMGTIDESTRTKTWDEAQKEIQKGIRMTWFHGCLGEDVPDELYGKSCEPKWSTDEIRQTVETYGFDNIGNSREDDMPIVWSQLRRIYETICRRKREESVNKFVLGAGKLLDDKCIAPPNKNAIQTILEPNKGVL